MLKIKALLSGLVLLASVGSALTAPNTTRPSATDMLVANCNAANLLSGGTTTPVCGPAFGSTNVPGAVVQRDGSGNFSAGTITASLTGHASLDLALSGGTMSGAIAMGGNNITGGGSATFTTFVGALTGHASLDLPLTGGAMSGVITMGGNNITGVGNIAATTVNGNTVTTGTGTLTIAAGKTLTDTSGVGANILLGTVGGGFASYGGASACGANSFVTAFSTAGATTCGSSTISGIALGSNLATLTYGAHLTNSVGAVSYNGSATSTLATDATAANTVSTIMARDGSGQVAATTFTGALTGHASLDLALTGGTMSGAIAMGGQNISGGGTFTATTFSGALTGHASLDLALTGGTMSGVITSTNSTNAISDTTGAFTTLGGISAAGNLITDQAVIAAYNANCYAGRPSIAGFFGCASAKASTGDNYLLSAVSNDAANQFFGAMILHTDATAANRRTEFISLESGIAFRNVSFAEGGGSVTIHQTNGLPINTADLFSVGGQATIGGHILAQGAAPTVSACGTSPGVPGGSDNFGSVVAGTGILTSCVINFGITWGTAPKCAVSSPTAIASLTVTTSTTQLTVGGTSLTSDTINWVCGSTAMLEPANDNALVRTFKKKYAYKDWNSRTRPA